MADERKIVKDMLVEVQRRRLVENMMKGSKTDAMFLNFSFDGKTKGVFDAITIPWSKDYILIQVENVPNKK